MVLNKRRGVVTTASDEKGRETVYAALAPGIPFVGPVGRLDKASEGLLRSTNDTEWAAQIWLREAHLAKKYHVQMRKHKRRADDVDAEGNSGQRGRLAPRSQG